MTRIIVSLAVFALAAFGALAEKVECVCVFYPHWHRYPKGDEWFGADKWNQGEWVFVKTARPRFPGAKQPMVPYAGYLDESSPEDMSKEIALAANAGIDVFLYDYYWYDGQVTQEEALEKGFLQAPNRDRMKFALMWCYHERNDQFRPKLGAERRRLMSLAHTKDEFLGLVRHAIERYFARPEYWRKDGKLFFSIFNAQYFFDKHGKDPAKVKAELDEARAMVRAAGLGEMHFNAQGAGPRLADVMAECGFDSLTDYNFTPGSLPKDDLAAMRAGGGCEVDYRGAFPAMRRRWNEMSGHKLPYIPNVTTGWDSTPRCRGREPYPWRKLEYPYTLSYTNNTPDAFREILADAKAHAERDPKKPGAVYINGWNEYTEGTYLVPNNFDSDGFLRAVASVFGRAPANEYAYINPSTKQLFTIPAATFENVPYGSHPKQKIDVFLPDGRKGARPVVMYIHGGGWSGGSMEDHIIGSSINMLLDRGIAVVCTGYRYLRDARDDGAKPWVMGCLDDCENALRYVKSHATEWNIDTSRIGLAGGSAGACTALYLALKDGNAHGIRAVAPIIAQTSMDPQEMREWIPNSRYGGHAFGYRKFDDWLAQRAECLADIERISPAALARKIDPARAPRFCLQYGAPLAPGVVAKDPTHSPVFGEKFKELCAGRGISCEVGYGGKECFGDAFVWLADELCATAGAAPMRFLSFNIYGYGAKEGMPPDARLAGVEESIAKCKADVISLQEVSPEWWNGTPLFKHLAAEYGIVRGDEDEALRRAGAPDGFRPPSWVNHEPLLYRKSRLKLLDSGLDFFHISLQAEKSVTWAVLEDREGGRRFIAFATHFWWQGNGLESDTIRELNARHVLDRVETIRRKWGDLPVIGGGDLNCRPGSLAHEVFRRAGYRNAADAPEHSMHRSHHGYPVRGKDGVFRGALRPADEDVPGMSLDHILFTPGVRALRHHIWVGKPEIDVSDHSPVTADFELTGDRAERGIMAGSPTTRFVEAARAAYARPEFAAYTNTIVHLFVGYAADTLDRPRQGDTVRWIHVPGARNVRDIGGWTGLREGRVYRGTELNEVGDHKIKIGTAGKKVLLKDLGIRTDLDFRVLDEKSRGACVSTSALGPSVRLVDAVIGPYMQMYDQTNEYATALRVFADEKNYPVYMHCWGGADRTGTVAFILEGLCGVSETDLAIDYELTSFAIFKLRTRAGSGKENYAGIIARMKAYPGATLAEKFAAYARGTLGLTDEEIAAIRRNLGR